MTAMAFLTNYTSWNPTYCTFLNSVCLVCVHKCIKSHAFIWYDCLCVPSPLFPSFSSYPHGSHARFTDRGCRGEDSALNWRKGIHSPVPRCAVLYPVLLRCFVSALCWTEQEQHGNNVQLLREWHTFFRLFL